MLRFAGRLSVGSRFLSFSVSPLSWWPCCPCTGALRLVDVSPAGVWLGQNGTTFAARLLRSSCHHSSDGDGNLPFPGEKVRNDRKLAAAACIILHPSLAMYSDVQIY
jgi:hypothetical protein